ncbi:MAG: hypothetical protein AB7E24_00265 [Novosphingobium sp.]
MTRDQFMDVVGNGASPDLIFTDARAMGHERDEVIEAAQQCMDRDMVRFGADGMLEPNPSGWGIA